MTWHELFAISRPYLPADDCRPAAGFEQRGDARRVLLDGERVGLVAAALGGPLAGPYTFQLNLSTFCGMSWVVSVSKLHKIDQVDELKSGLV